MEETQVRNGWLLFVCPSVDRIGSSVVLEGADAADTCSNLNLLKTELEAIVKILNHNLIIPIRHDSNFKFIRTAIIISVDVCAFGDRMRKEEIFRRGE